MKLSYKALMVSMSKTRRKENNVVTEGISIKKQARSKFSTSDKLKLSCTAREGDTDTFTYLETDEKYRENFRLGMT